MWCCQNKCYEKTIIKLLPLLLGGRGRGRRWSESAALVRSLHVNVGNQYNDQDTHHPSDLDSNPSDLNKNDLALRSVCSRCSYTSSTYVVYCIFSCFLPPRSSLTLAHSLTLMDFDVCEFGCSVILFELSYGAWWEHCIGTELIKNNLSLLASTVCRYWTLPRFDAATWSPICWHSRATRFPIVTSPIKKNIYI